MIDALRFEWIKLRTVRSNVFTFLAAVGLVVLVAVISAVQAGNHPETTFHAERVTTGVTIAQLLFGILGVQIIGQEYRFNTIRTTFAAIPRRVEVLVAKLIVIAVSSAVFSVVMLVLSLALGKAIMGDQLDIDSKDHRVLLGTLAFAVLWAIIGFALGAIVRQPIAGILVLVLWSFVVEGILANLVSATKLWLPFVNGIQMTSRVPASDFRSPGSGAIYFTVVTLVLLAIGFVLARRRDA